MPATAFTTPTLTPPQDLCPVVGASVIDSWTPQTSTRALVRGFTAAEILPILWNAKKVRFQSAFSWEEWDETGPTFVTSGNYSYDDEVTGPGASGTAVEPVDRLCQDGYFDFTQARNIPNTPEYTHSLAFSVYEILVQGSEWALDIEYQITCDQYHDEQDNVDFTGSLRFLVCADIDSVITPGPISTFTASIFGKNVTMKIFGYYSYNLRTLTYSASASVSESWTY